MPALIILLITSLACLLIGNMPSLTVFFAIVWGSSLIAAAFYLKQWQISIIFLINIGIVYFTAGSGNLIFYLCFFGLAAIVMSLLLASKRSYYEIQKWGIIAAVVGITLFMGILYFQTGQIGEKEMEKQLDSYLQESLKAYEDSGLMALYEEQGLSKADVEASFDAMAKIIPRHLPAFYYLQGIVVIFFMLLTASFLSFKLNIERLKKRPYSQEIMPWQLVWIAIAGLGLWLWGREQMDIMYYAGSNILVLMAPISIYYGIAALAFKIGQQSRRKKRWIITALLVLSVVFPPSAVIFFSLIGLFDALLDFRKLRLE